MNRSFEQSINSYKEVAKDALEGDLSSKEQAELDAELASKIRRISQSRESTPEDQQRIYALQKKKQEIMLALKERIRNLDTDKELGPRNNERRVRQENGVFKVRLRNGKEVPATKGEIMTDMDWGMYYHLDPKTVDRNVRKRYLIEDAKHELEELLDKQITIDEVSSAQTHEWKRVAYEEREKSSGIATGLLAEKMVKGYLKQLSYDLDDADFDVINADAHQDVDQKMDFIVKRKRHERGVEVEETAAIERVGVQFTTNMSEETLRHKEWQLNRAWQELQRDNSIKRSEDATAKDDAIKDLVLVQIPPTQVREAYYAWKNNDRLPGGPQKQWDEEVKEDVFRGVMKDVLPEEEINDQWEKVLENKGPGEVGEELST